MIFPARRKEKCLFLGESDEGMSRSCKRREMTHSVKIGAGSVISVLGTQPKLTLVSAIWSICVINQGEKDGMTVYLYGYKYYKSKNIEDIETTYYKK